MSDVKHRLGTGKSGDDLNIDVIPITVVPFTFDRIDITFDAMLRTFDET